MGADSYSILTAQPHWKKTFKAPTEWKYAGILMGFTVSFAMIDQRYRTIRRDRADDHDRSIFAIKKSFGTMPKDQEAWHYKTFGKYD